MCRCQLTLTPECGVQIISTGIFRPPEPNTFNFILGRASATIKGLTVPSSLVDNDYSGEKKISASAPFEPVSILHGQCLAQVLFLPLDTTQPVFDQQQRSSQPCSSDIYWVQMTTKGHPMLTLKFDSKEF